MSMATTPADNLEILRAALSNIGYCNSELPLSEVQGVFRTYIVTKHTGHHADVPLNLDSLPDGVLKDAVIDLLTAPKLDDEPQAPIEPQGQAQTQIDGDADEDEDPETQTETQPETQTETQPETEQIDGVQQGEDEDGIFDEDHADVATQPEQDSDVEVQPETEVQQDAEQDTNVDADAEAQSEQDAEDGLQQVQDEEPPKADAGFNVE